MLDDYLKLLRKYTGKTLADAAKDSGLELSRYISYEKGKSIPDEDECLLLSKMLGFDADILTDNSDVSIHKLMNLLETKIDENGYVNDCINKDRNYLTEDELYILSVFRNASDEYKKKFINLANEALNNK